MTVPSLKDMLGVPATDSLPLFKDVKNPDSGWFSYFNSDTRVQMSVHADTLAKIKAGEAFFLRTSERVSSTSGKPFVQHVLCISDTKPDETL